MKSSERTITASAMVGAKSLYTWSLEELQFKYLK